MAPSQTRRAPAAQAPGVAEAQGRAIADALWEEEYSAAPAAPGAVPRQGAAAPAALLGSGVYILPATTASGALIAFSVEGGVLIDYGLIQAPQDVDPVRRRLWAGLGRT